MDGFLNDEKSPKNPADTKIFIDITVNGVKNEKFDPITGINSHTSSIINQISPVNYVKAEDLAQSEICSDSNKNLKEKEKTKADVDVSTDCLTDPRNTKKKQIDHKDEIIKQLQNENEQIKKESQAKNDNEDEMSNLAEMLKKLSENNSDKFKLQLSNLENTNKEPFYRLQENTSEKNKNSDAKDAEILKQQNDIEYLKIKLHSSESRNNQSDSNINTNQTIAMNESKNPEFLGKGTDWEKQYKDLKAKFKIFKNMHNKKKRALNGVLTETTCLKDSYKEDLRNELGIKPKFSNFVKK